MSRTSPSLGLVIALSTLLVAGCTSPGEPEAAAVASRRASATDAAAPVAAATRTVTSVPIAITATPAVLATRVNRDRDAFVLLSGGGTQLSNNYSQYLQARAIAAFFERECPPERTWIFFGAGNREGEPAVLADARREIKRDGLLLQSWLPGSLPRNRPATRASFLGALRKEILPVVREGGTLYLFIGDHGELAGKGDAQESAITMWQLKPNRRKGAGWVTDEAEILRVGELRQALAEGLGDGRVVFAMTQCHGGGFHELGVAHEMTPPSGWFSGAPPEWAVGRAGGFRMRAAGFTATDAASPAAGCDADPDPERWAGYERFLPESLLGIDLMSGQAKGRGAASFAEAHEQATLVDHTIDKPRSTSEQYLEAWARLIESRLATTLRVTSAAQAAIAGYQRAVDRGEVSIDHEQLGERRAQFARFTQRLVEQLPDARELLQRGTRQQLEAAIRGRGERGGGRGGRRGAMGELRRAWTDTLRPAWKTAVLEGRVSGLTGAALEFEKRLLKLEDGGRDFLLPRGGNSDALMEEIYWASSYADPARFNRAQAEDVTRWGAERRTKIIAWAKASPDAQIRAAGEKIGPGRGFTEEPARPISRMTAAERVLFYRRVLAAWEFLIVMQAEPVLAELAALIELERLPVRP